MTMANKVDQMFSPCITVRRNPYVKGRMVGATNKDCELLGRIHGSIYFNESDYDRILDKVSAAGFCLETLDEEVDNGNS